MLNVDLDFLLIYSLIDSKIQYVDDSDTDDDDDDCEDEFDSDTDLYDDDCDDDDDDDTDYGYDDWEEDDGDDTNDGKGCEYIFLYTYFIAFCILLSCAFCNLFHRYESRYIDFESE